MVQWYYPIPVSPISQKRCNFWCLFMLEIPHLQNNLQTTVSCNMAPLPRLGSSDQIWNHIGITTGWKNKSPRNRFYSPLITPQNGRIPYKINWSKVCSGSFGCGPRPMLGMCLENNKHHQSCDPCPLIVEPWCDGTELTWQTWNHCPNYTWKKSKYMFKN